MIHFLDQLRVSLSTFQICERRVLIGVSGGADSVALLCGLFELQSEFKLHLTVAHLDHMLRGEESAADATWVQEICDQFQVPCVVEQTDVTIQQSQTKQTLEESARNARYEFFERTAALHDCSELALAHTA
ncbi:MAG: tRNA lysidine(34) synthetase TilS, partial [Planctomycetaceae bacterium]|nr:tRNA lysidine(34) synthetase TilS [Planctomycetaceae bacterium]